MTTPRPGPRILPPATRAGFVPLHERPTPQAPAEAVLLLLAVGITAACLRSPVTAVGAELSAIRPALHLGPLTSGALTALPLAVFAVAGLLTPAVVRRVGTRTVVLGGLAALAVLLLVRAAAGSAPLLLGATALLLVAVGWINVALPPLVPAATGVFSAGVLVGIAAPAALAVPIGSLTGSGWRGGIAIWALLPVAAMLAWRLVRLPDAGPPARAAGVPARTPVALALFFGAQSLGAFAVMGWLPQIFRDAGLAPSTASLLLAVTVVPALPAALLLPTAVRRGYGRPLVLVVGSAQVVGLVGLMTLPAAGAWLWALLLTTAHWGFPLAMALVARRGGDTRVSAQVQGTGYALAVAGPLLLGPLHDGTGAWTVPVALLAVVALLQVAAGLRETGTAPTSGSSPATVPIPTLPIPLRTHP